MKMMVFSVFDKKSELYQLPFYMGTTGEALRAFQDLARDERTVVYRHPSDFKLCHVGFYENLSGRHENLEVPTTVAHADEFDARQVALFKAPAEPAREA